MRRSAVFVLSDVRSGSTLLDQCLGAHPSIVSLGEIHWLRAYVELDRSFYDPVHPLVCTCGRPVRECHFWREVATALGRPLESLRLHWNVARRKKDTGLWAKVGHLPRRLVRAVPALYRNGIVQQLLGGHVMARDCMELFDAVSIVSNCPLCVDSSKSPYRFRAVYDLEPSKTLAVILSRDYRAIVHSKMKRGESLDAAASGWRKKMNQIDVLTRDLSARSVITVKYESFCENPKKELIRLCRFLDLEFSEAMLRRLTEDIHHIGGSPSKFDDYRVGIALDRSYEDAFSPDELQELRKLVGDSAARWGY